MDIADAREKIDALDGQIGMLLGRRFELTDAIGREKAAAGAAVRDEARENAVLEKAAAAAGEEYSDSVREVYAAILGQSRARQEKTAEENK